MNATTKLTPIALASLLSVLGQGCLLKIDALDAGADGANESDDDDPLADAEECLLGSEIDAVGLAQVSADPGCEVVCASGWGLDAGPLEIEWTQNEAGLDGAPTSGRALGQLADGRLVVAHQVAPGGLFISHYEPDGVNFGGFEFSDLGTDIYGVTIDTGVVYVTHGDADGTVLLSALSIADQQQLWQTSYPGTWASAPARGGGQVSLVVKSETEPSGTLVTLDLDGNPRWMVPSAEGVGLAFSPSGQRIAVAGSSTRVYAADDGAILDEFVHGALWSIYPQAVAFVGEDRVVTVGMGLTYERFEAWIASDSMIGGDGWERVYNRADVWCPADADDEWTAATSEFLSDVTVTSDGELLVIGAESQQHTVAGTYWANPWVGHLSTDGELIARSRGLWEGYSVDVIAGPGDYAFVLSNSVESIGNGVSDTTGHQLRKYVW